LVTRYNSSKVKELNKKIILKTIQDNEEMTRAELVKITGLAPSSVTRLTRELIQEGYLVEAGIFYKNFPGRNGIKLRLNSSKWKSLNFDVGVNETIIGVGFFDSNVDVLKKISTPSDPKDFFTAVKKIYEEYARIYQFSRISFSIPGMCNMETNEILLAPNLNWKNVKIPDYLNLDIPVIIDNEANLSLLAEQAKAEDLKTVRDAVFIIVREGVGTGIMINGSIYRGHTFTAGEAGHMTVDINSKINCHCGSSGCWELYSSINWAIKKYGKDLKGETPIERFENLKKKKDSEKVLREFAKNIAVGIVNIVNILNPELVILGGEIADMPSYFYDEIWVFVKRRALDYATTNLRIRPSIFKTESSNLVGAAVIAVKDLIDKVI